MAGTLATIAESVCRELLAATLSRSFEAVRLYVPTAGLEELSAVRVTVRPAGLELAPETRTAARKTVVVELGVQERLGDVRDDEQATDDHVALVEEIADLMRSAAVAPDLHARWLATEVVALAGMEDLERLRVMTSVLRLTYRTVG